MWRNDDLAVQVLDSLGVTSKRASISLDEIDAVASKSNRARIDPLSVTVVDSYALAMRNGDVFPEIVLRAGTSFPKEYVIAGGNHRFAAAQKAKLDTNIQALIIECDDLEFDAVCKALNSVVGLTPSEEQKVQQAAELVKTHDMSCADAARVMRVTKESVASEIRANRMTEFAILNKVTISQWSRTARAELASMSELASVPLAILRVSSSKTPTQIELKALRKRLASRPTEAQKLEEVQAWSAERNKVVVKRVSSAAQVRSNILHGTTQVQTQIEKAKMLAETQLTADEGKELVLRWKTITSKLSRLLAGG